MTDQQIIERLAEFMDVEVNKYEKEDGTISFDLQGVSNWNPLKDWNHWRMVEEKIANCDGTTPHDFCAALKSYDTTEYIEIDLPTRCKALVSVLDV